MTDENTPPENQVVFTNSGTVPFYLYEGETFIFEIAPGTSYGYELGNNSRLLLQGP